MEPASSTPPLPLPIHEVVNTRQGVRKGEPQELNSQAQESNSQAQKVLVDQEQVTKRPHRKVQRYHTVYESHTSVGHRSVHKTDRTRSGSVPPQCYSKVTRDREGRKAPNRRHTPEHPDPVSRDGLPLRRPPSQENGSAQSRSQRRPPAFGRPSRAPPVMFDRDGQKHYVVQTR